MRKIFDIFLYIILIPIFYIIMTPLGLLLRIVGIDFLARRINRDAISYWHVRK